MKHDTIAVIIAVIGSIITVFFLSWLLHGVIGGDRTLAGFFVQNLVIFAVAAAITKYIKDK